MPLRLTEPQVAQYRNDGFTAPVSGAVAGGCSASPSGVGGFHLDPAEQVTAWVALPETSELSGCKG
jgi:hypothetical protein